MKTSILFVLAAAMTSSIAFAQLNIVSVEELGFRITNDGRDIVWTPQKASFTFRNLNKQREGNAKAFLRFAMFDEEGSEERFFTGIAVNPGPQIFLNGGWQYPAESKEEIGILNSYKMIVHGYQAIIEHEFPIVGGYHSLTLDQIYPTNPKQRFFPTAHLAWTSRGNETNFGFGIRTKLLSLPIRCSLMTGGRYDLSMTIFHDF